MITVSGSRFGAEKLQFEGRALIISAAVVVFSHLKNVFHFPHRFSFINCSECIIVRGACKRLKSDHGRFLSNLPEN